MKQIDMSAQAVTARLKLASELRRLCLLLATAKVKPGSQGSDEGKNNSRQPNNVSENNSK